MKARRLLFGADVLAAAVLAAVLLVIVNFLAARWDHSFDWTRQGFHSLSPKTLNLLKGIADRKEKVRIASFFSPESPHEAELQDRVVRLLDRYKAACPSLEITHADFYRNPAQAKTLAQEMIGGPAEANSVIFRCGDRHKPVSEVDMAVFGGVPESIREFKAEDAFSTALNTVLQAKQPAILYVTGHGERSLASDKPKPEGFEGFQMLAEREGLAFKAEPLGASPLEGRADLVIVAGPTAPYLPHETEQLHNYLLHGGRLLMMLDPAPGQGNKGLEQTGLETLVARWGVTARDELVIDPRQFAGMDAEGRPRTEVFRASGFSPDSPITKALPPQSPMIFAMARPVEPTPGAAPAGIQVKSLVRSEATAWAKHDLRDLARGALKSDPHMDRAGPHVLAVQVEINPPAQPPATPPTATSNVSGPAPLPPDAKAGGRAVLIGDADLAANQVIEMGANRDFLFNAVYWLLDRQDSMGISSKSDVVKIVVNPDEAKQMSLLILFAAPVGFLCAGVLVWWMRRQ